MIKNGLKKYFWDVDLRSINIKKHKSFILERILEMGDSEAVRWMRKNFSEQDILSVLKNSRRISKKSFNFWILVLGEKRT